MKNLKDLKIQLTNQQIIDALKAKVLKGGTGGINCPPPYGK